MATIFKLVSCRAMVAAAFATLGMFAAMVLVHQRSQAI